MYTGIGFGTATRAVGKPERRFPSGTGRGPARTGTGDGEPRGVRLGWPRIRGLAALVGVSGAGLGIALGAQDGPWVPGAVSDSGTEGPLASLAPPLGELELALLLLAMFGCYLIVLASARALPLRWIASAVVCMHLVFMAAPLLLSRDAFLYLAHARAGSLSGLNPYVDTPADAAGDPVLQYVFPPWADGPSIYGPLFTVLTYALAPLGVAGGIWALKAAIASASLGCVTFVFASARRLEKDQVAAAAFVGLNPVLLVWVVGGAHNDALLAVLLAAGIYLSLVGSEGVAALALVAAAAVKATAGVVLPLFLLGAHRRRNALRGAALAVAGLLLAVTVAFGSSGVRDLLGSLLAARENVSPQSLPSQLSSVVLGAEAVPVQFVPIGIAVLASVATLMLWRTSRGTSWTAAAGWTVFALLASTVWLRPWHLTWLLPLAALGGDRGLRVATLGLTAFVILAVPLRAGVPESLRLILAAVA